MSLFQTTIAIDPEVISKIVEHHWKIVLGKIIKASQNHTFQAHSEDFTKKYVVRVTPDPQAKHLQRIRDESIFVNYLAKNGLKHICAPILPVIESPYGFLVRDGDFNILVIEWAKGEIYHFHEFVWAQDQKMIRAWGRFLAQMHQISRKFEKENQEVAQRIQQWNQTHHGILSGVKLDPLDEELLNNPDHFGVVHGDLNISNIYYSKEGDYISAFDTDQVQRGFYLWDISQAVFTCVMLQETGFPITCTPVPQVNQKFFEQNLIKGYQQIAGQGSVDLNRLTRMVNLKRQFYRKFCVKALQQGNIPKDMEAFIVYIVNWLEPKSKNQ